MRPAGYLRRRHGVGSRSGDRAKSNPLGIATYQAKSCPEVGRFRCGPPRRLESQALGERPPCGRPRRYGIAAMSGPLALVRQVPAAEAVRQGRKEGVRLLPGHPEEVLETGDAL